ESGDLKIVEQNDRSLFGNLIPGKDIGLIFKGGEAHNGGTKQYFRMFNQEFALLGLKEGSCAFGSFVNITKKIEILRMPCLPDPGNVDFNGLGGGYSFDGDELLLAVGAPENISPAIRKLAQDMSSPYGKVIRFKKSDLDRSQNEKFEIFSAGHRNPQGMLKIGNNLYLVEHGPKGGDEINLVRSGSNYGWPIYSLGTSYQDRLLYKTAQSAGAGPRFINPLYSFVPSIGISDITECPEIVATRYAPLRCLLVSSLRASSLYVVLVDKDREAVASVEKIEFGERIREFVKNTKNETYILTDVGGAYMLKFDMAVRK
ncbi:MAG: PQQ-dependent sugar dehydrogenase, partial [Proteobacteria bacterium]|nr:PQQ-dependent sugar dehydrogenase [Pseudomonadota bacterium]